MPNPLVAELRQRARITSRIAAAGWRDDLKRTSPVDTGLMRDQTTVKDASDSRGAQLTATVDTDYAEYVRSGTAPHKISAVNAQALRFNWKGGTVFFASVQHPGTAANDWFDNATKRVLARMPDIWGSVNR